MKATGLDAMTVASPLVEHDPDGSLGCRCCAHRCRLHEGGRGRCCLRFAQGGQLRVPHGYVSALNCDPIEKKPFFHFLPGASALSFGMLGCNFHCPFCQNWTISQTLRDPQASCEVHPCTADSLVDMALRRQADVIASTYNEPLITSEWSLEIFRRAKAEGLHTVYVSNGFASTDVLEALAPWLDGMNVDLKCFTEAGYRQLGGRLAPVQETIRWLWDHRKWVEVVTLVVPGFNDSPGELQAMADFVASVSPDLPWHLSAYHANYRYADQAPWTPVATIEAGVAAGRRAGLRFVYAGNLRGMGNLENTLCPNCQTVLIERDGFQVAANHLIAGGCPACHTHLPGVWHSGAGGGQ